MIPEQSIAPAILAGMRDKGIDVKLTLSILSRYNRGDYAESSRPVVVEGLPPMDDPRILDLSGGLAVSLPLERVRKGLESLPLDREMSSLGTIEGEEVKISFETLGQVGSELFPLYAMGVFNGGSATSYADKKRNRAFNAELFTLLKPEFELLARISQGRSKGVTPAFLHPIDNAPGPSFMELKMRALLLQEKRHLRTRPTGSRLDAPLIFQMTSVRNNKEIRQEYALFKEKPLLRHLIEGSRLFASPIPTGVQPLLGGYTHSRFGDSKGLFMRSLPGGKHEVLAMPGGHGQCFAVLQTILKDLQSQGKRFVSLGNVDNIGYVPDPVSLALLALSGRQALFNCSIKTASDVKGGVLVMDSKGRLTCVDIGVAISKNEVEAWERQGRTILFNCGIGLFDLDYLIKNLDRIITSLPVRFVDQNKDIGLYSQAEQVTWEVMGLMDDIGILAVDKFQRLLAAKTILENLMTSGVKLDDYPADLSDLQLHSQRLNEGLLRLLAQEYGMVVGEGDHWIPKESQE